ncbi:methionine--tRNA ligase subunit beta [bacterium]|nr:methionine--tRNA ligase subunit beta [bacterium]
MITFDDFKKLEIRIGKIISAEKVEGADKLLKLEVDLGEEAKRQLVAGIAEYYKPEELIDKETPVLVNLEPRKIRGIESQGMLLAAVEGDRPVLLHPDKEVSPGSMIR